MKCKHIMSSIHDYYLLPVNKSIFLKLNKHNTKELHLFLSAELGSSMKRKNTFCQNFIVFYYKPSSGVLKNSLFILYCFVDNFRCNLNFWWLLFKYSGNNNDTKYKITQTCLVSPLGQLYNDSYCKGYILVSTQQHKKLKK